MYREIEFSVNFVANNKNVLLKMGNQGWKRDELQIPYRFGAVTLQIKVKLQALVKARTPWPTR